MSKYGFFEKKYRKKTSRVMWKNTRLPHNSASFLKTSLGVDVGYRQV